MKLTTGMPLSTIEARTKFDRIIDQNKLQNPLGVYAFYTSSQNNFVGIGKLVATTELAFELGYSLLPQHWRQGYGKEISAAMMSLAATQESINHVSAVTDPNNVASQKILISCGFQFIKELSWHGRNTFLYEWKNTT